MNPINIIARKNGVGIDRDVHLIEEALQETASVHWTDYRQVDSVWMNFVRRFRDREIRSNTMLHLLAERVPKHCSQLSGVVALIPNQERFPRRHLGRLRSVDHVLCKSQHAVDVFSKHASKVSYIGFTSEDRDDPEIAADYDRFFHLAGKSTLKGTSVLLDLWSRNPQWPKLTIVQSAANAPKETPANVRLISEYLHDSRLRELQNQHGIHLCPSLSEGWGHYIVEAMSCGAVVVTTDGPPMNELVREDRGILVPYNHAESRHLGMNWHVDPSGLSDAIESILAMPDAQKERLGKNAAEWFQDNDAAFRQRFRQLVAELDCER